MNQAQRKTARAKKGRHRAPSRGSVQPYAWLGAGAITLGMGAALASGAGIAHAEEGSSNGTGSTASVPSHNEGESGSVAKPAVPVHSAKHPKKVDVSTTTSTTSSRDAAANQASSMDSPAIGSKHPKKSKTASALSSNDSKTPESSTAGTTPESNPISSASGTGTPKVDVESPSHLALGVAVDVQPKVAISPAPNADNSKTVPLAALAITALSTASPNAAESTATVQNSAAAATSSLVFTQADVDAYYAAMTPAYIAKIKSLDPTDRFLTPASADYHGPQVGYYAATVQETVDPVGTNGFTRNSSGTLTYKNTTETDVMVGYGDATKLKAPATGFLLVNPGKSVAIPGGGNALVLVEGPRINGQVNVIAGAGPGYVPATASPTSGNPVLTVVSQAQKALQSQVARATKNVDNLESLVGKVGKKIQHDLSTFNIPALYNGFAQLTGVASDILEVTKKFQHESASVFSTAVGVANLSNTIGELEKNLEIALAGGNGNVIAGTVAFVKALYGVAELTVTVASVAYIGTTSASAVAIVDLFVQGAGYALSRLDRALG